MQQVQSFFLASLFATCALANDLVFISSTGQQESKPFTEQFSDIPENPDKELSPSSLAGLIAGFSAVGIFIIYANIKVILDEKMRHAKFEREIATAERTLRDEYKTSADEMNQFKDEFERIERGEIGLNNDEEDALADIN